MGIRVVNAIFAVDLEGTIEEIDETMKDYTIRTLKDFVDESTEVIPVWSGASRASFLKLASIARTTIDIVPVAPIGSRIPLGRQTSVGKVIGKRGEEYGWEWASDLDYIDIVQDRVAFRERGIRSVQANLSRKPPTLPNPKLKRK